MEIINIPLWAWIVFYVLVFIMLIIDLKSFGRKGQHEVSVSEALKMTAQDLFDFGVIERIIRQPKAEDNAMFESLKLLISRTFEKNMQFSAEELTERRYNRFRKIGTEHLA